MAAGAIARCLEQYGEATLITALRCVTQTSNNKPGAVSARMIKALCAVLHGKPEWLNQGSTLLEVVDSIDLVAIEKASSVDGAVRKVGRVQAMSYELRLLFRGHDGPTVAASAGEEASTAATRSRFIPAPKSSGPSPAPRTEESRSRGVHGSNRGRWMARPATRLPRRKTVP
jgi:hypothetical protein